MKIFSLKKELLKTKIIIFGVKFSLKRNYEKIVARNYKKKLAALQKVWGQRKIKVGFLVSEPAKWQYQSLYEEFDKSDYFEPVVLITQLSLAHQGEKHFYKTIDDCYDFFKGKGLNVTYAYDKRRKAYMSVSDFGVDILFYQQPWELDDSQHPIIASKSVLTCYVPYGLNLMENSLVYTDSFHRVLWKMFVEDCGQIHRIKLLSDKDGVNALFVGYPKLDAYYHIKPHKNKKKMIIYAPHHSFEKSGLNCATFQENGMDILALAEKYQEKVSWIFKPHPRFKTAVISNNVMSETEIDSYYRRWEKIGMIHDNGDYMQLFVDSDALITDSISFLGEYLPSKNPLFHLVSPFAKFNDFAKSFIDSFYQIYNVSELEKIFEKVVFENEDLKKDIRLAKINILFDSDISAASKIFNFLKKSIEVGK